MKKSRKFLPVLICLLAVTCVCFFTAYFAGAATKSNAQIQSEIDALGDRMKQIETEKSDLQSKIDSERQTAKSLSAEISNLNHEIAIIDEQVIIIDSLLVQYGEIVKEKEEQIAELEVEIAKQQRMLDDMIRMSFEYDSFASTVEFIFSAENFSDLISRMDLISYHLSYNNNVLEKYKETSKELENTKAEYEESLQKMSDYKAEKEALKEQLVEKQRIAAEKQAQALESVEEYEKELEEKKKYVDQLNSEIKALAAMFAKEDKSTYSGILLFPLPSNVSYTVTSYYGNRQDPFTGKQDYHNGYDFACPKGTPILAADDGTVVIAAWNGGYGNCVTINHGGGLMTLYGHCSSLNVVSGQKVKRGDVIAYVGSTGRSTGNHLHFTTYKNGNLVDPADYLGSKF
ncbi:MAG: peptidoglycan DD-metalloendopeptidase family protein [Clostridia bacterium]|nr:peptidoglycan DD-metalloendopeptidase family protein [Clostridia bacterium]